MKNIQDTIKGFLIHNKVAAVCFVDEDNKPYCINCFYVFDDEKNILIFKSSTGTIHHNLIKPIACVSGTILPETLDVLKLKGIQFIGKIIDKKEVENLKLNSKYLKKYPMSLAIIGYVWAVRLDYLKLTDNTLGFGNKIIWKADKD
jgi:uncharacterized protein YhbP (UPF0306 family)